MCQIILNPGLSWEALPVAQVVPAGVPEETQRELLRLQTALYFELGEESNAFQAVDAVRDLLGLPSWRSAMALVAFFQEWPARGAT